MCIRMMPIAKEHGNTPWFINEALQLVGLTAHSLDDNPVLLHIVNSARPHSRPSTGPGQWLLVVEGIDFGLGLDDGVPASVVVSVFKCVLDLCEPAIRAFFQTCRLTRSFSSLQFGGALFVVSLSVQFRLLPI